MPGMIKPLVWSVTVPLLLHSWKRLLTELTGKKNLDISNMVRAFYYRAYFNVTLLGNVLKLLGMPKNSIEILTGEEEPKQRFTTNLGMIRHLPRIFFFVLDKISLAKKTNHFLLSQNQKYRHIMPDVLSELNDNETLQLIDGLYRLNEESSYFLILVQLINGFLDSVLKKLMTRHRMSVDDLNKTYTRMSMDFVLAARLSILHEKHSRLSEELKNELKSANPTEILESRDLGEFGQLFKSFIDRFGHLSDSNNDFSHPQWRENLPLLLKVIEGYGRPKSPTEAEAMPDHTHSDPFRTLLSRIISGIFTSNVLAYRAYAAQVGSLYAYGYSLFRPSFLHLGVLFKNRGLIEDADDILYLTHDEVRKSAFSDQTSGDLQAIVENRKKEMSRYKEITLPDLIFGESPEPVSTGLSEALLLHGLATSEGYYEGRAKVLRGLNDFPKIEYGDVIVIPYSDVGWTPVFAKAKAVISESGGMLSHCSIIAREYGIPAVVSVRNAMRIKENAIVTVDGFDGKVTIKD